MKVKRILKRFARELGFKGHWSYLPGYDWMEDVRFNFDMNGHIFDVGANRGQSIDRLARLFPDATYWCFEPDPDTYRQLKASARPRFQVNAHNLALGNADEVSVLHRMRGSDGNSILPTTPEVANFASGSWAQTTSKSVSIRTQRLDTFCKNQGIREIELLKIDTQGYEEAVLEGCGEFLSPRRIRVICLEVLFVPLYENQSCWTTAFETLRSRGFQLFDLYEKNRKDQKYLSWCDALFVKP